MIRMKTGKHEDEKDAIRNHENEKITKAGERQNIIV
jgi:hypothetical protein